MLKAILATSPPLAKLPSDLEAFRVRRRDQVGGVIHESEHAA
jgi:hypothetical protein